MKRKIGTELGISSQFYADNLERAEHPPLKLKLEEVTEFPPKLLAAAKKLKCWAFLLSAKRPTVVGFTQGQSKCVVYKAWFTRQQPTSRMKELFGEDYGKKGMGIDKILVTDIINANIFLLNPESSGWNYWWRLSIMYDAHPYDMRDSRELQAMVDLQDEGGTPTS